MLSLNHLPTPPGVNCVTACENDGQLHSFSPTKAYQTVINTLGSCNIEVVINPDTIRPAQSKYEAKEAFSAHTETVSQRLMSVYYEEGILSTIRQIVVNEREITPIIRKLAEWLLVFVDRLDRLKLYLPFNFHQYENSSSILDASLHAGSSSIVNVAWHPHCITLAAVFADDSIRIYGKGRNLIPLLKHRLQRNITQIEWMPYSTSILGVGCESGILLWSLDPISVVTRPSGSCLTHLSHPGTVPTSSFTWHPKGLTLACTGGRGRELVVWDIGKEDSLSVHWGLFSSFVFLLWSPDGTRLLAGMSSSSIKVFESRNWTFEHWSLEYPLQSAIWSQCGRHLLFVTKQEPFVFCLSFYDNEGGRVGGSQVAVRVADFTPVSVTCEDGEEMRVGGPIKQLAWDPKSERLAVLFKECELIALIHTHTTPQLHLAPGGFIRGETLRVPLNICFQNNASNGSVLTIVWSGGLVKHVPLCYSPREPAMNSSFNTSIRPLNQSAFANYTLNQSTLASQNFASPCRPRGFNEGPTSPGTPLLSHLFTSPT